MKPITFVATSNPQGAIAFYQHKLGFELIADEPYAIVFDMGGYMLRVQKVDEFRPHTFTSLGFDVPDIRAKIKELSEKGIVFQRYPHMEQDEVGIWETGSAKVAWFVDPDGNVISLTEF